MILCKEYFFSYSLVITFITLLERLFSLSAPQWMDKFITQIKYYVITDPDY